ncbi:hypothetical protein A2721_01895 [Candidatus Gottesmanbacteria bacterium RIFCSPHIGHO2_01_FULL_47_48]|uniref:Glycosyl transferase family 1 domain-containing protein n=1 Tax=Candidatus Gottesmanbacteria bacterium RIFCSPHIGHO2_01_FULL_47_48 TaxID=1798381 RepID=A0A1F6A385_9BACT|nr:MAG: hypothetical protein A2721_01895 [Candidatus Gottesmanbacteria bacterium RIFCSPHIGHO2_01_FULL_47_48]
MNLRSKFALYIGNAYPHKNLEFLVKAWKNIDMPLILAGGRSVFYDRLKKIISSDNITLIGPIENPGELYKKADVFIFPSLMEGFGLPPLEAMKHSVPVVASDIPVLHEVLDGAAIFFNPNDPIDLKNKLSEALLRKAELIKKGHAQVKKYSWEKTARQTLQIYKLALNNDHYAN